MLAGGTEVDAAAWAAMRDVFRLARLRVTIGPGELPKDAVDESSHVIDQFVRAAQEDLESGGWRRQFRP